MCVFPFSYFSIARQESRDLPVLLIQQNRQLSSFLQYLKKGRRVPPISITTTAASTYLSHPTLPVLSIVRVRPDLAARLHESLETRGLGVDGRLAGPHEHVVEPAAEGAAAEGGDHGDPRGGVSVLVDLLVEGLVCWRVWVCKREREREKNLPEVIAPGLEDLGAIAQKVRHQTRTKISG